jgi:hypothetical protein
MQLHRDGDKLVFTPDDDAERAHLSAMYEAAENGPGLEIGPHYSRLVIGARS